MENAPSLLRKGLFPGDVDGDGEVSGMTDFTALDRGGEALGYEVSLYLPQDESVTPVRYMMEPEYISPDTISQNEQAEKDSQAKEQGKENNTWTVQMVGITGQQKMKTHSTEMAE